MKVRSDSLFAKLKPAQREELLDLCVGQGASGTAGQALCATWGLSVSSASLSRFFSSHGMPWRIDRAKAAAEATRGALPKDWESQRKRALAQKEFELTFRDLSAKEWFMLKSMELDERQVRLKETIEPKKLEILDRRVTLLEKQAAEALATVEDGKLSDAQKADRIREIFKK